MRHPGDGDEMAAFAYAGWLNIAGGCCGTTPGHIRALAEALRGKRPRRPVSSHPPGVSGVEAVFLEEDNRPLLVGERTNVIGSRKFRELIAAGRYEEAAEIARRQVKGGAQIIDVCLADPDRDELEDMERFLEHAVKRVKVPLMIDSTDPAVVERALTHSQGKAIINSINLEEGEERFAAVVPLLRRYGAAVVVGTIDEGGMAVDRERKLAVARRSYELLTEKYKVAPEDIIFDPLVFQVGTGDEAYIGSARDGGGHPADQRSLSPLRHDPGHFQRFARLLRAGRGAERRLSLPRHEGGVGLCHRQYGEAEALRVDPPEEVRLPRGSFRDNPGNYEAVRRIHPILPAKERGEGGAGAPPSWRSGWPGMWWRVPARAVR